MQEAYTYLMETDVELVLLISDLLKASDFPKVKSRIRVQFKTNGLLL